MMNPISTVKAHCKAFFTTSLLDSDLNYRQSLSADAIAFATFCLHPLSLLKFSSSRHFWIRGDNVIALETAPSKTISFRVYLFAVIFFIPGLIATSVVKIVSLIMDPTFRQHYRLIVNHYISKQEPHINPPDDPLKDPLIQHLSQELSLRDISQLAKVNKLWFSRARIIFPKMVDPYLQKQNSDLTPTTLYYSLQTACPSNVFNSWEKNLEKILELPKVEFQLNMPLYNLHQELKKHKIARTKDFQTIVFLTSCEEMGDKGILIIQRYRTMLKSKIRMYWSSDLQKNAMPRYIRLFENLHLRAITDLIQGNSAQLLHYAPDSPVQNSQPLTFEMVLSSNKTS